MRERLLTKPHLAFALGARATIALLPVLAVETTVVETGVHLIAAE